MEMRFKWDEEKRKKNVRRHGFDFADTPEVFENIVYTIEDDRFDYGETRYFTLGIVAGRIVALSHTEGDGEMRIISLRKANRHEQEIYFTEVADRLGKNRRHDR